MKTVLHTDTRIWVEYSDETVFGGALSPKLQENLRTLYRPIYEALEQHGPQFVMEHSERLLGRVRGEELFSLIRDKNDRLRFAEEVLYPDASQINPLAVHAAREDGSTLRFDASAEFLAHIHDAVSRMAGDPFPEEELEVGESITSIAGSRGLLTEDLAEVPLLPHCDATFVGHNAVLIRSGSHSVLIDPWLLPRSERFDARYQPLVRRQLGTVDAIAITHSHPDHFDPGSLLQFNRGTKVIIPRLERESLMSADLALRVRQLGFTDIVTLDWWQQTSVGEIEITALPFYGEQPTNSDQICPEVRMMGNTYMVRTPRFSCALIADGGRDRGGDVRNVALEALRRWGPIDVLFTGYRGWSLYPIQYFECSVRQYLLFVPQHLYPVRQSIMNGISEAVDTAETWHASYIAPYGDGGAPWYSELGLGPDPRTSYGPNAKEWVHFDPLPERVADELKVRTSPILGVISGSRVKPLILRPGQSFNLQDDEATILEIEGSRWPLILGASA